MMAKNDHPSDNKAGNHVGAWVGQDEQEERGGSRCDDRREGDDAAGSEDYQEKQQGKQDCEWCETEKYAQTGGDTLPTGKAKEGRTDMAKQGSTGSADQGNVAESEKTDKQDRYEPFCHVPDEG